MSLNGSNSTNINNIASTNTNIPLPKRSQSRVVLGSGRSPSNSVSNGFVRASPGGKKTNIILTGHMRTALVTKEEEISVEPEKPILVPNLAATASPENTLAQHQRQAVFLLKPFNNRRMSDVLHDRLSTKTRELPNLENKHVSRSLEDVPTPIHSSFPRKSRERQIDSAQHQSLTNQDAPVDDIPNEISDYELAESPPEPCHVLLSEEEFLEYIRTRQLEYGELELEVDHVIIDESDDESNEEDLLTPIAELQLTGDSTAAAPAIDTSESQPDVTTDTPATTRAEPPERNSPEQPRIVDQEPLTSAPVIANAAPTPNTSSETNVTSVRVKLLPWSLNSVRAQLDELSNIDEKQKGVLWHIFSHVQSLAEQFEQANEEWRAQSVNDTLNPQIGVQVRAQLCTALACAFDNNFNSWRLFGQYHIWDYIQAVISSRDVVLGAEGAALTQAVNMLASLPDPNLRFRRLICAGLK